MTHFLTFYTTPIYDMSGNVWEWCADHWHDRNELKNIPKDGSAWVDRDMGAYRVNRGGGWFHDALSCRATYRSSDYPSRRGNSIGFRVVLFPPPVSWPVHQQHP